MFRFLVVDQDLQIIEVALTVIAPRPRKDFFKIWMLSLWLAHGELAIVRSHHSGCPGLEPKPTQGNLEEWQCASDA